MSVTKFSFCPVLVKRVWIRTCYLKKSNVSVMPSISSEVLRFKAVGLRSVVQAHYPRFKGFRFKD